MGTSAGATPGPITKQQPVHEVRLGTIKAAIWRNETDAGARFNATFERIYNVDGEWRSTGSFGRDDLLVLAKVADEAHSWIMNTKADAGNQRDRDGGEPAQLSQHSLPKR